MAIPTKTCDGCQRPIQKAHARFNDLSFCGSCYKREFHPSECAGCGKSTRVYQGKGIPLCKSCRLGDRACAGCGKHLAKAAKIIEGQRYCWPCVTKTLRKEPCEMCGELAAPLSRAPSLGIEKRICQKCRDRLEKVTCGNCGKYRKSAGSDSQGRLVCQRCLDNPIFLCPSCGQEGIYHSKSECTACYWQRKLDERLCEVAAQLTHSWLSDVYLSFGEDLLAQLGSHQAYLKIVKHDAFFQRLNEEFHDAVCFPESQTLLEFLGNEGLRRYATVVSFLLRSNAISELDSSVRQQFRVDRLGIEDVDLDSDAFTRLLSEYLDSILKRYEVSKQRKLKSISDRTLASQLRAARHFLQFIERQGYSEVQSINRQLLERFFYEYPGYEASLGRFINFVNQKNVLFSPLEMEQWRPRYNSHLIIDWKRWEDLIDHVLDPETPALKAVIGVLSVFFLQTPKLISHLKMSQISIEGNAIRIRLADVAIEVEEPLNSIFVNWLTHRKALLNGEENEYLFPGRLYGSHISAEAISYHLKQWEVKSAEVFATGLFRMYRNGLRHPNVVCSAYGISKATASKYLEMFDVHLQDVCHSSAFKNS